MHGTSFAAVLGRLVWSPPLTVLFLAVGLLCTIRLRFFQFRRPDRWLGGTIRALLRRGDGHGLSRRQAAATALSATVGTGNIAGVASAIAFGGPGAVFWMWVAAALGMATAYCENVLGVRYRRLDGQGGPMEYLTRGLRARPLAVWFCLCCAASSLGLGCMVQSSAVAEAMQGWLGVPGWISGLVLALGAGVVILGGVRRIGAVAEKLVPAMVGLYLAACAVCLFRGAARIPAAFAAIFSGAFQPLGIAGGLVGTTVRCGVSRGLFSNEAGLGSSVMVNCAAPGSAAEQGQLAMFEVFVDTLVVCTVTALTVLVSGVYDAALYGAYPEAVGIPGGLLAGAPLTQAALRVGLGTSGGAVLAICLSLFAFSTLLGWSWYGRRAVGWLFGVRAARLYCVLFVLLTGLGAVLRSEMVWNLSDAANGLMAVPNLIAVVLLPVSRQKRASAHCGSGPRLL